VTQFAMTTRNLSASLTMPQRFRLSELDRSRSTASQQNRLRAVLEVRLRQLEHDRRTALAGITRAQRKIQQQSVATINRSIQAFLRTTDYDRNCLEFENEPPDYDDDKKTSTCQCDCCRCGLCTGKNRPTDMLQMSFTTCGRSFASFRHSCSGREIAFHHR